jgi:hypothetical protein
MITVVDRIVAVAQLPHPGGEWWPDKGTRERGWTDWNTNHARKFLYHSGRYVDEHGNLVTGRLTFWGEWEGPSNCQPTGSSAPHAPAWFQVPHRGDLTSVDRPQNTDPFVFGGFLYSNCMQDRVSRDGSGRYRPTAMQGLARGSVILFGSSIARGSSRGRDFVLDTCFVVGDVIDIDAMHFEEQVGGRVPEAFVDATLKPIFKGVAERKLSLYLGMQHDPASNSAFSFFPCWPADKQLVAFPRPVLQPDGTLRDVVNPMNWRRFHLRVCDRQAAHQAWSEVRGQVESAGCKLGTYADPL